MMKRIDGMKNPINKLQHLLTVAAVLLLLALVFVTPAAAETVTVTNADELARNLTGATVNGNIVTISGTIALDKGIVISLPDSTQSITLTGNGVISRDTQEYMFKIANGIFILGDATSNLVIDGNNTFYNATASDPWKNTKSLIRVQSTGENAKAKLIMNDGVTLQNNHLYGAGGALYVHTGDCEIYGGKITGNTVDSSDNTQKYGGGICVSSNGVVKISGDTEISDNFSYTYGGGIYNQGSLTITGNVQISNNTAPRAPAGIYSSGGGIYTYFTAKKLEISGNVTITGNKAESGGGIQMPRGSIPGKCMLILSGNPVISGNTNIDGTVASNLRSNDINYIEIKAPLLDGTCIGITHYTYLDKYDLVGANITKPYSFSDYSKYFYLDSDPNKVRKVIEGVANDDGTITLVIAMQTYAITTGDIQNGSVIVPTEAKVDDGVTITAVPNEGYKLADTDSFSVMMDDGTPVSLTDNTFTMPSGNVTVTATFTAKEYAVKPGSIPYGTLTTDKGTYNEDVQVVINPLDGYKVDSITAKTESGDDVSVNGDTFAMPADNVTVSATFSKIEYDIEIVSSSGGSISTTSSKATVGDQISVTANAEDGKVLKKISVTLDDGSSFESGLTFAMPADNVTLTAEFVDDASLLSITLNPTPATGGTISTNVSSAKEGDFVKITVTPAEGYRLVAGTLQVNGGVVTIDANNVFQMPAGGATITATFSNEYEVVTGTCTNGAVSISSTSAEYDLEVTVEATPSTGYEFAYLTITKTDDSAVSFTALENKFSMPAYNVTVTATFEPKLYTIDTNTENGTIEATHTSATMGTAVTFLATPKEGYEFVRFNITPEGEQSVLTTEKENPYVYTMTAENITVTFEVKPLVYTIALDEQKVTISLDPNKYTATFNAPITVTATADAGYVVNQIQVLKEDGSVYVTISGSSGSFTMPASDITIKAVGTTSGSSPSPTSPSTSSSTSQGSSTWLPSDPTQTPTDEKPTDTVPTDIPNTQPTATPSTSGFGILAVLAGLGAVAVLRRK